MTVPTGLAGLRNSVRIWTIQLLKTFILICLHSIMLIINAKKNVLVCIIRIKHIRLTKVMRSLIGFYVAESFNHLNDKIVFQVKIC